MEKLFQPMPAASWAHLGRKLFSIMFVSSLIAGGFIFWGYYQPPENELLDSNYNFQEQIAAQAKPASKAKITEDAERRAVCIAYVDVDGGVTPLYPIQPGKVLAIPARENTEVEAGDILIRMDDTLQKAQLEEAKADVQAGQSQLDQAKVMFAQHELKINGQKSAIEAKRSEMAAAVAKKDQAERLASNKLASNDDVNAATAIVKALEFAVEGETIKLKGIQALDPHLPVNLATNDLTARRARLQKAEYALGECSLKAPFKGTILRINTSVGETLGANPRIPAIMFCPTAKRIIRAEVEQEFAGKIALNQVAVIQDDCSSSEITWRGKVVRISDWFTHRRSILLEPLQFNDVRTLECIVELDPGQPLLRIGQRVRVQLIPSDDSTKPPTAKSK